MRLIFAATMALLMTAGPAWSVNVVIDFSFDEEEFFGAGNPDGADAGDQARAAILAAADFYSGIIGDSLSGGSIPERIPTSLNPGGFFEWRIQFSDPGTGAIRTLASNVTIAEDEYRIFAGGRALGGNTLGIGGSGGFSFGAFNSDGSSAGSISVTGAESAAINSGIETFTAGFIDRGQPTDEFNRWGGAVTFDGDGSTNWHFGVETLPSAGESDFFSVALHELGHALGFGGSSEWNDLVVNNSFFTGAASTSVFGSNPPIEPGHLAEDLQSTVLGTNTPQEVAFDPIITQGTRKLVTTLDAASLVDIGWEIELGVVNLAGDFNGDGLVNAADYALFRDTAGTPVAIGTFGDFSTNFAPGAGTGAVSGVLATPEPATAVLLLSGPLAIGLRRRTAFC